MTGGRGRRRPPVPSYWSGPGEEFEVRRVQPYEATKPYLCPGCQGEITKGTGHVVAVPIGAEDLRRHWHHGCWANRENRRPGR